MKFDFDDIVIVPSNITGINSRYEVDPYDSIGKLPIMTSPMDTVVSIKNYMEYQNNSMYICLPRISADYCHLCPRYDPSIFNSISLTQAEKYANYYDNEDYICIDMANGHIPKLHDIILKFNEQRPRTKLIVGNVATPEAYLRLAKLGVWGVRIGIGAGAGCTTSANTGVHYPYASLIKECYELKKANGLTTKIIADGGTRKFSDIIKALALGADLVMIGSLLNKSLQSCSDTYLWKTFKIKNERLAKWLFNNKFKLYKKYRGMSTKEVQKSWGNKTLKTAEGISKWNRVEYDLYKWTENFRDYLRSAMSYTNSKTLEEFKDSRIELITQNAFRRFNK